MLIQRLPPEQRNADHYLLAILILLIGFGSLAFHLFANRGTSLADLVPIGMFMLVYLGFTLNRMLAMPTGWTVMIMIAFAALVGITLELRCWDGTIGFPDDDEEEFAKPCFNGTLANLPALFAMLAIGIALARRGNQAASLILWASATFAVSILFRATDVILCDWVAIDGRRIGTHFIWHLINGVTLFLLFKASLCVGPHRELAAAPRWAPGQHLKPSPPGAR